MIRTSVSPNPHTPTSFPIQGLWIGESLSLMEQLSIRSFQAQGYEYHLYVYGDIHNAPEGTVLKNAAEILPQEEVFAISTSSHAGSYAAFANRFRFKLLYEKGGIWSDSDVVCLRQIDLSQEYIFTSEGEGKINNTFMKTPPLSEVMLRCYEQASRYLSTTKNVTWRESGSNVLAKNIADLRLEPYVLPPVFLCSIPFKKYRQFIDADNPLKLHSEACCLHLWNEMWRTDPDNIMEKNARYPKESLYGCLQERFL